MDHIRICASDAACLRVTLSFQCLSWLDAGYRFPRSLSFAIIDTLEKIYLAGFPLLQLLVALLPTFIKRRQSSVAIPTETCVSSSDFTCPEPDPYSGPAGMAGMEFLPLMLTSVYCAIGLVWGFCRLMFLYLNETYQGASNRI